ncbi:MAG: hypothetical protein NDF55_10300 [archaeon GB-1867-005]|nr:hypothetical protein [Candidatus Culexmicrobium cathedralense]
MKVKVHRVGHGRSFSVVIPKPIVLLLAKHHGVSPDEIEFLELDYRNGVILITIPKEVKK